MKQIDYLEAMALATEKMAGNGVFLSVGGETPNVMTIGWGAIGYYWRRPVFTVVVRPQRHTHALITAAGEFVVSVPTKAPLARALAFAGSQSGRDVDKFAGHGLTPLPAQQVSAPIIAECGLHFECRTLLTQEMAAARMDPTVLARWYPARDLHTVFFGEIILCYTTD